jgi:hypothetical protein
MASKIFDLPKYEIFKVLLKVTEINKDSGFFITITIRGRLAIVIYAWSKTAR